ncbi:Nodule Cysteine-Rich (NCR) secreted peptide [Medicago truncatula]|uniref:Nodule Cysteine-Rich (NCR) secreted peptide n=1 Tax=Medicago truncatula TaxID=3880 RepID=A0A072TC73_MEDTR|nr:Nodule Cysteine-Rich (NCR) secreted peptide [Medicago truncatula]
MAGILKFFYIAIIYVSLYLVVIEGKDGCKTKFDCLIKYPDHNEDILQCIGGHCLCLTN